jgi:hypothetical protein
MDKGKERLGPVLKSQEIESETSDDSSFCSTESSTDSSRDSELSTESSIDMEPKLKKAKSHQDEILDLIKESTADADFEYKTGLRQATLDATHKS